MAGLLELGRVVLAMADSAVEGEDRLGLYKIMAINLLALLVLLIAPKYLTAWLFGDAAKLGADAAKKKADAEKELAEMVGQGSKDGSSAKVKEREVPLDEAIGAVFDDEDSDAERPAPAVGSAELGVSVLGAAPLRHGGHLCISKGSVVGFEGDAIVNAANEACQGGGGVDGAISAAGGVELAEARAELPVLPGTRGVRCLTGSAVITTGGQLAAIHCIHAVGPNYYHFNRGVAGASLAEADRKLYAAYAKSMELAAAAGAKTLGFALLSSGIFRGPRSVEEVLAIAYDAITNSAYKGLVEVHLIGFTDAECAALTRVAAKAAAEAAEDEEETGPAATPGAGASAGAGAGAGDGATVVEPRRCDVCLKTSEQVTKLNRCCETTDTGRVVRYCSKACQAQDFKQHKAVCAKVQKRKAKGGKGGDGAGTVRGSAVTSSVAKEASEPKDDSATAEVINALADLFQEKMAIAHQRKQDSNAMFIKADYRGSLAKYREIESMMLLLSRKVESELEEVKSLANPEVTLENDAGARMTGSNETVMEALLQAVLVELIEALRMAGICYGRLKQSAEELSSLERALKICDKHGSAMSRVALLKVETLNAIGTHQMRYTVRPRHMPMLRRVLLYTVCRVPYANLHAPGYSRHATTLSAARAPATPSKRWRPRASRWSS